MNNVINNIHGIFTGYGEDEGFYRVVKTDHRKGVILVENTLNKTRFKITVRLERNEEVKE